MKYFDLSPREEAGMLRHLAHLNAQRDPGDPMTAESLLRAVAPLASWADTYAPDVLPVGDWMKRWTADEKKGVRALGLKNPQIQAWLDDLDNSPTVTISHAKVQQGVPVVCAALEQAGVIPAGQGAVRAAAIAGY